MSVAPKKVKIFSTIAKLVLASGSPRRRQLLEDLGLEFVVQAADVPEIVSAGESPAEFVKRLSLEKAMAVAMAFSDSWILGADTVVVSGGGFLASPPARSRLWRC